MKKIIFIEPPGDCSYEEWERERERIEQNLQKEMETKSVICLPPGMAVKQLEADVPNRREVSMLPRQERVGGEMERRIVMCRCSEVLFFPVRVLRQGAVCTSCGQPIVWKEDAEPAPVQGTTGYRLENRSLSVELRENQGAVGEKQRIEEVLQQKVLSKISAEDVQKFREVLEAAGITAPTGTNDAEPIKFREFL